MAEMFRVTQSGGILGLAISGEPRFEFCAIVWEEACRELDPEYERPMIMDAAWNERA